MYTEILTLTGGPPKLGLILLSYVDSFPSRLVIISLMSLPKIRGKTQIKRNVICLRIIISVSV